MPLFLIITKLLLLKILTIGIDAYEYGYHPSAEEFDSLIRGTSSTWTRNRIANERRSEMVSHRRSDSLSSLDGEYFVPRFRYEKIRQPYESTLSLKWPGHTDKVVRKFRPTHSDQQSEQSLTSVNAVFPENETSTIDLLHFGNEINAIKNDYLNNYYDDTENNPTYSETIYNSNEVKQQISITQATPTVTPFKLNPTKITHGTVIQIDGNAGNAYPTQNDKNSLDKSRTNHSNVQFPILFSNPVTGIVYAITEVGRTDQNLTRNNANSSIPIYVSKDQYDRDLFLMRKKIESQCSSIKSSLTIQNNKNIITSPTVTSILLGSTSTKRPRIIRLPKPPTLKISTNKLPDNPNHLKPPPMMVQTAVTVNDQVQLPPPKRSQKLKNKNNRKKKKQKKRPGRKPPAQTFFEDDSIPQILKGTRTATSTPILNRDKPTTQLERPSLPTTVVFSGEPIAATSGYVLPKKKLQIHQLNNYSNHRLNKRSLQIAVNNTNRPENSSTKLKKYPLKTAAARHPVTGRKRKHSHQSRKVTKSKMHRRNRITGLFESKTNSSTSFINKSHATPNTILKSDQSTNHSKVSSKKRLKTSKRGQNEDGGFDVFDLLYSDEDDDSEYYYNEDSKKTRTKNRKRKESIRNTSIDASEDPVTKEDKENNLKEETTYDNSSSAEEDADFGALEEYEEQATAPKLPLITSQTKTTNGKMRIRRRPAVPVTSASAEDYSDDTDDDEDGGGVGSFFRMVFYPVQIVMGRIVDSFASTPEDTSAEEVNDKYIYPTYTQYSSAIRVADSEAEDEDAQGSYFSNWFSSLFGFNRRTKKIGSTTTAQPETTKTAEPGWFESWFGFGDNAASSAEATTSNEDDDDYDKWFSSWFNSKPKARRRTATTTTTSATLPQVPILTIVDPMKNPQNWLGILAHHLVNATTTTQNPIIQRLTRATTTENPDIPRFISYDKYQIWRLKLQNDAQVKALEEYKRTDEGDKLQWLKGPSLRGLTDVLVPPKSFIDFQGALQFESIAHEILIFDVGKAIAYEQTKEQFSLSSPRPNKHQQKQKYASLINMSWNKYYEYDDIVRYLETVRMRHPQIVELLHIGRTYEGRPLIVVKLEMKTLGGQAGNGGTQTNHKKLKHKRKYGQANAVFIEAGTHGLEWIGPATATWTINELLRVMKSNKSTTETDYIRNTTWYIMPVLNPDGYVYSHEYDRFWRKTRSRHVSRPGGIINSAMTWLQQKKTPEKVCYGVDLDRNWHYQWGKRGSSKSACNEHYAGPSAFSEPETKALSEFLIDNRKQMKLFISMQAYGQIISYPTKASANFDTERSEDLMDLAMAGVDGLRKKGNRSRYKIDSANDLIEHRSGCSDAFAAYQLGIPFSYTLYLADNGVHGYLLPSSSIEPTARDAFEIVISMLDYI